MFSTLSSTSPLYFRGWYFNRFIPKINAIYETHRKWHGFVHSLSIILIISLPLYFIYSSSCGVYYSSKVQSVSQSVVVLSYAHCVCVFAYLDHIMADFCLSTCISRSKFLSFQWDNCITTMTSLLVAMDTAVILKSLH